MRGEYAPSWLAWEEASGGRATFQGSPEDIKNQYIQLVTALVTLMPKPSENVDVVEGKIDNIGYRSYAPKNASGPLPICIWTHGGGWMMGDLNSDDLICRLVAEHTNSAVVNVDYRLTPEHVWPAQLEDSLKVYKWAHANASSFHGDPNKMYTAGGSAGGGLALQIANKIVKDPELKSTLKGVAALVPTTAHWDSLPDKYKSKYKSYTENAKGTPVIDGNSMEIFYEHAKVDPHDPEVFTLLATDNHKNFPPVYFTSCEFDPLRDDAYVMEEALKEAGVPTKHDHYPGMPHYFWIFPPVPESQTFIGNVLAGIGWLQGQM